MRLQLKVPLVIAVTLLVVLVVSGSLWTHFQRQAHYAHFQQLALGLSGTVLGELEEDMLSGERELIQKSIVRISLQEAVGSIRLLSPSGVITAASETREIGELSEDEMVRQTLVQGTSFAMFQDDEDADDFLVTTPVFNSRECESCHGTGSQILGVIQVGLPTTIMQQEIRHQTRFFIVFGGLCFLGIGLVLWITLRKLVLKPLHWMSISAQTISEGKYTARVNLTSLDEIGVLAGTFNQMAAHVEEHTRSLEESRRELAAVNAGLEERIFQGTREYFALNRIITTVNQSLDLDQILQQTLEVILKTLAFDRGVIQLTEDDSTNLTGKAYHVNGRQAVADLITSARHVEDELRTTKFPVIITSNGGSLPGDLPAGSLLSLEYVCVPLKSQYELIGALILASDREGTVNDVIIRSLEPIGEAIGIAVGNAKIARRLDELNTVREQLLEKLISAQEAERRRIARELHDEASQSLAALILNLESIGDAIPAQHSVIRERLNALQDQVTQTLHGVRNLALELRPSALDDLGLSSAIDWYAKDFLKKRGLTTEVSLDYTPQRLSIHAETSLFRIIQEALNNVIQHAEASHVKVGLSSDGDSVRLQVSDNGRGFNVSRMMKNPEGQRSLGLHGMVERTSLLGGTMKIESKRGRGTQITVEIPLEMDTMTYG